MHHLKGVSVLGSLEYVLMGVIVLLIAVLAYETAQYKKFLIAQTALHHMGEGMQEGFKNVVMHLNSLAQDTVQLKQDSAVTDDELVVIRTLLDIHSEKLELKDLMKLFNKIDRLKAVEDE